MCDHLKKNITREAKYSRVVQNLRRWVEALLSSGACAVPAMPTAHTIKNHAFFKYQNQYLERCISQFYLYCI